MITDLDLRRRNFLVVDDDRFLRAIVKKILTDMGAQSVNESDDGRVLPSEWFGPEGVPIDCVVSDYAMPRATGLELLKSLRAGETRARHDLPFMMVTGHTETGIVQTALALDVSAFLVKPISKALLAQRLSRIFAEPRTLQSAARYANVGLPSSDASVAARTKVPVPRRTDAAQAVQNIVEVALEDVPDGAELAEPIVSERGVVVLGDGATIDGYVRRRLEELRDTGVRVDTVKIRRM
jgi:CheY-like chemotaxis protein